MKATDPQAKHGIPPELLAHAVPIASVQRWPGNPRVHDLPNLRASLAKYGQPKPVVAQKSSRRIFAGNGIHEAAEAEGWTHIACTLRDWPDLTCREFLADDNKSHERGRDDFDALARFLADLHAEGGSTVGFEARELDRFLASVAAGENDGTAVPEVAEADVWVKPGDVFALGDHRLACGDAFDETLLDRLFDPGVLADCVFTSPPYAVGVEYGPEYEDNLPNLQKLLRQSAARWWLLVRPGGFAVINFGDIASGRDTEGTGLHGLDEPCEYPMALEYWPRFREVGWVLWSRRVWVKPTARVHSPWAIQSNRAATDFEHVWTWKKTGPPIVRRQDGAYSSVNGWWDSTHGEGVDVGKDEHGAGMALVTALRALAVHSERGGVVHEPFAGTGTTIIAAEQLERRCLATELSPRSTQIALTRWEQFTERKAERL